MELLTQDETKDSFRSFCSRMWLDYNDEHMTNPNRLTEEEYVERWHEWLLDRWQNRKL